MICRKEFEGGSAVIQRLIAALEKKRFEHWVVTKSTYRHLADQPIYGFDEGKFFVVKGKIKAQRSSGRMGFGPCSYDTFDKMAIIIDADQKSGCVTLTVRADDELVKTVQEIFSQVEVAEKPSRFGGKEIVVSGHSWANIGGLEEQKQELRECIEWPLKRPEIFDQIGITPPMALFCMVRREQERPFSPRLLLRKPRPIFFRRVPPS